MHVNIGKTALLGVFSVSLSLFAQTPKAKSPTLQEYNGKVRSERIAELRDKLESLAYCDNVGEDLTAGLVMGLVTAAQWAGYEMKFMAQRLSAVTKLRQALETSYNTSNDFTALNNQIDKLELEMIEEGVRRQQPLMDELIKLVMEGKLPRFKDRVIPGQVIENMIYEGKVLENVMVQELLRKNPNLSGALYDIDARSKQALAWMADQEEGLLSLDRELKKIGDNVSTAGKKLQNVLLKEEKHLKTLGAYLSEGQLDEVFSDKNLGKQHIERIRIVEKNLTLTRRFARLGQNFMLRVVPLVAIGIVLYEDYHGDKGFSGGIKFEDHKLADMSNQAIADLASKLVDDHQYHQAKQVLQSLKQKHSCK